MRVIERLTLSAYGMHFADQIALVAVPLAAALVFEASAETIGLLVACQSLAHLLGSLPSGLVIDRADAKTVALGATLISLVGFAGAALGVLAGSLLWFAVAVTAAGFGIVVFVLVSLSIVPRIAPAGRLAGANARIEIPRAIASFVMPLGIGLVITEELSGAVFAAAAACALAALWFTAGLPRFPAAPSKRAPALRMILEGGRHVLSHALLLPIALCAVCWNLAFAALLAVMVPLTVEVYLAEPGVFGVALSAFGLAGIAGSWLMGRFAQAVPPNLVLLFGPGSSVVALAALLLIPPGAPALAIYAAFFLLGFGPAMWLITQNSVRQLVTPAPLLGRVNAVIQTAIYGMRPLGALLGGAVAGAVSPQAALVLIAAIFLLSFAAALFSRLRSVRAYADLAAAGPV